MVRKQNWAYSSIIIKDSIIKDDYFFISKNKNKIGR